MSEILSLSRNDDRFFSYLSGRFSKNSRAIATRTLHINSHQEKVTFRLVPLKDIDRPSLVKVWLHSFRPMSLNLSFWPLVSTYAVICFVLNMPVSHFVALTAVFSVLTLHVCINLLDDYYDHLRGWDRINKKGGSQCIQNGWLAAYQVQRAALAFLGVAVLLAIPSLIHKPLAVISFGGMALLSGFLYSMHKVRGIAEAAIFLLFGPLLTLGMGYLLSGQVLLPMGLLGIFYGTMAFLFQNLKNMENLALDAKVSLPTIANGIGFESSRGICLVLMAAALVSLTTFVFVGGLPRYCYLPVIVLTAEFYFLVTRLFRARFCYSGEANNIREDGLRCQLVAGSLLTLAIAL